MNSIATKVGIDVSKDVLDIYIEREKGRKTLQVPNDLKGIARLIEELGQGPHLIALEASGRYEALARHELEDCGYEVRLSKSAPGPKVGARDGGSG